MSLGRASGVTVLTAITILGGACSEPPEGLEAFKAAQQLFEHTPQFAVTWRETTALGKFAETAEFDCSAAFYHDRSTKDLSPKGLAEGATLSQGRPRAHQETEQLFVDGHSYHRNSGSWENASINDNGHPDWGMSSQSFDPTETCRDFAQGKMAPFVPFDAILKADQITYKETRGTANGSCYLYEVAFPSWGYSDTMTTVTSGSQTMSFRPQVTKVAHSMICLDARDSLPRQGQSDDTEFSYSYDPIPKMSPPR